MTVRSEPARRWQVHLWDHDTQSYDIPWGLQWGSRQAANEQLERAAAETGRPCTVRHVDVTVRAVQ